MAGPRNKYSKTKHQSIKRTILLSRRTNASKARLAKMKADENIKDVKAGKDRQISLRKRSI